MGKRKDKLPMQNSSNERCTLSSLNFSKNEKIEEKIIQSTKRVKRKAAMKREIKDHSFGFLQEYDVIEKVSLEEENQEVSIDDDNLESLQQSNIKISENSHESNISKNSSKGGTKGKNDRIKSNSALKKNSKKRETEEDAEDSEEERWLDAIESGKLEEVDDELKRMKNPMLMTARQRALLEKRSLDCVEDALSIIPAEPLMALPSGFKEKVLTEDMILKKAIKIRKRREQAIEKREEDKKKTVDRLLKKQDPKVTRGSTGSSVKGKNTKKDIPVLSYYNNKDGAFLCLPPGYEHPLSSVVQTQSQLPKPVLCGVKGCKNLKKYTCSKTTIPLCSLECYKRNIELSGFTLGSVS